MRDDLDELVESKIFMLCLYVILGISIGVGVIIGIVWGVLE